MTTESVVPRVHCVDHVFTRFRKINFRNPAKREKDRTTLVCAKAVLHAGYKLLRAHLFAASRDFNFLFTLFRAGFAWWDSIAFIARTQPCALTCHYVALACDAPRELVVAILVWPRLSVFPHAVHFTSIYLWYEF